MGNKRKTDTEEGGREGQGLLEHMSSAANKEKACTKQANIKQPEIETI